MKNTGKAKAIQKARRTALAPLIALSFTLGFAAVSLAGCDNGSTSGGGGNSLKLSGNVVQYNRGTRTTTPFTGSVPLRFSCNNASGKIENGKLSATVGTPTNRLYTIESSLAMSTFLGVNHHLWSDWHVEPPDTLHHDFVMFIPSQYYYTNSGDPATRILNNQRDTNSGSFPAVYETVSYLYVDKDATLSAKGKTNRHGDGTQTVTQDVNLNLKEGWNMVLRTRTNTSASSTTSAFTCIESNPGFDWEVTFGGTEEGIEDFIYGPK